MDDWRAQPDLTLNLGLRYEAATVPGERHGGKLSNLPSLTSTTPHLGGPFFRITERSSILKPRLFFEMPILLGNGQTSHIRSGFGILDNVTSPLFVCGDEPVVGSVFPVRRSHNIRRGRFPEGRSRIDHAYTFAVGIFGPNPPRSYDMQWNFNIQQNIIGDTMLQAGHAG